MWPCENWRPRLQHRLGRAHRATRSCAKEIHIVGAAALEPPRRDGDRPATSTCGTTRHRGPRPPGRRPRGCRSSGSTTCREPCRWSDRAAAPARVRSSARRAGTSGGPQAAATTLLDRAVRLERSGRSTRGAARAAPTHWWRCRCGPRSPATTWRPSVAMTLYHWSARGLACGPARPLGARTGRADAAAAQACRRTSTIRKRFGHERPVAQRRVGRRVAAGAVEVGEGRRLVDVHPAGQVQRELGALLQADLLDQPLDLRRGRVRADRHRALLADRAAQQLHRVRRGVDGDREGRPGRSTPTGRRPRRPAWRRPA